jgi:hypothetical protein
LAEKLNFDRVFSSPAASEDKFFAVFYKPNKASRNRIGVSTAKNLSSEAAGEEKTRSKLSFSAKITVLNRKPSPSLGPPLVNNSSSCLGRHARPEAVGPFSF